MQRGTIGAITDLRGWLSQRPFPYSVRVDGKAVVRITSRSNRWAEAEKTIRTLAPERLEALDRSGDVIRATACDTSDPAATIERADPMPNTWPESELATMAQIMTAANDRACARQEASYRLAFDRLYDLVKVLADRLTGIEGIWVAELERRAALVEAREAEAAAAADGNESTVLLGQVAQAALLRMEGPAKKPAPKANGAP